MSRLIRIIGSFLEPIRLSIRLIAPRPRHANAKLDLAATRLARFHLAGKGPDAALENLQPGTRTLLGMSATVGDFTGLQDTLDTLLRNIVTSSAIEGEQLNVGSVRSSLARRLGLADTGKPSSRSEGLAELLLDATGNQAQPLTLERLYQWHRWLFPQDELSLGVHVRVGALRGEEPMQVVSGRLDCPTVHFEAPPRAGLEHQMDRFLDWLERSRLEPGLDPLLRAGIAHFWFVTLHHRVCKRIHVRHPRIADTLI